MRILYKEIDRCGICPHLQLIFGSSLWKCELTETTIENDEAKEKVADNCPLPTKEEFNG